MDGLGTNPFAVLTFIVAPAVLTNASSLMALQTANRFARTIDRARALAAQINGKKDPEGATGSARDTLQWRQLLAAENRGLLLVRALTAFYLSVGSFAGASFASLVGAIFVVAQDELLWTIAFIAALCSGAIGIGGLLAGSGLLVWETRKALAILRDETEYIRKSRTQSDSRQ